MTEKEQEKSLGSDHDIGEEGRCNGLTVNPVHCRRMMSRTISSQGSCIDSLMTWCASMDSLELIHRLHYRS